jgi:nucleoid-associated protein YgaU
MKINPIALFTVLAVAAASVFAYVTLKPATKPEMAVIATAPAPAAAPAPVAEVKKPEEPKIAAAPAVVVKVPEAAKLVAPILPSFDTVRVETSGEAVIAGRAEPDTEVVAKLNGTVIATTKTNSDGAFVMIPDKPLPAGAGALSLESKASGVVQVSSNTVAVAVKAKGQGESTVAVLAPDQPTKIIQAPAAPSNAVVLDAVDYDATGNIVFSGRANPGAVVRLYVDNNIAGEVKANEAGKWNYVGNATVAVGTHTLRADEISRDGSVASRVELPFLREAPAKVAAAAEPVPAPAAPAVATAAATTTVTVAPAAAPAAPQPTRIVIQPGNNLWTLSRQIYGFGRQYTVIYEANKDQIRNPRLIYPGQIITAPVAQGKTP